MCGKWRKIKNTFLNCSFSLRTVFALITDAAIAAATEVQRKCVNTYNARFFFLLFIFFLARDMYSSVRCGMIRTKNKRRVK